MQESRIENHFENTKMSTETTHEKIFMCHFDSCSFKSKRSDGLKVHINETHKKILKQCAKCGKTMTSSSLSRHKRNNCKPRENVSNDVIEVMSVDEFKIEANVSVLTHSDGHISIIQPKIEFNGISLFLTTKNPDQGNVFFFIQNKKLIGTKLIRDSY